MPRTVVIPQRVVRVLGTGRPDFDAVQNVLLNVLNEPFNEVGRIIDEAS